MPPKIATYDEQEFDQPHFFFELPGQDLNSESILYYFMNSPFFDGASNNVALFNQARLSPEGQSILNSREKFEEALQTRYPLGLQFVVVAEPQEKGQPWVIQRQYKFRPTDDKGRVKDVIETQIQGTYYTVGSKILMAPTLLDVLQMRLLATTLHLQTIFELSKDLSHYSPATGHTYLPPSYSTAKPAAPSRLGSPGLAPEADADASQATAQALPDTSSTEFSDDLFLRSLAMTNHYGHEYMDENPLQGEPGSFVFGTTTRQVEARNKAQAAAQASGAAAAAAAAAAMLAVPQPVKTESVADSVAPTPKPAPTPVPMEAGSRKGSVTSMPKASKNRRKSKGLASPTSPTGPVGP